MRRTRRVRDYPPIPWANPDQCLHPAPVTLLKLNDADERSYDVSYLQGNDSKRTWFEGAIMAEKEVKPDLADLVAEIAREECRKM
jgi:hypothetical protein